MQLIMYGIPNCQTVKKARDWLDLHTLTYSFFDFKKQLIDKNLVLSWLKHHDIKQLLNRSGLTYRKLSAEQKLQSESLDYAIALMLEQPSIIKRPILVHAQGIFVGFHATVYQSLLIKP